MSETISTSDLHRAIEDGTVVVLEALPPDYYEAQHIPGALNLPLDDVETRARKLVPDHRQAIVTYCSNTSCNNSTLAAQRLQAMGYLDVRKYADGKQGWAEAGHPLEGRASAES